MKPKEITKDIDSGVEVASFGYYDGIKYAEDHNLKQSTKMFDVFMETHFIVCCGDVMVKVSSDDFPEIERRLF